MIFENEEVKRLQQAFQRAAPGESPRSDCPPPEDIWAGVRSDLPPDRLSPLLRHLASCPVCTESWRLAQHIYSPEDEEKSAQESGAQAGRASDPQDEASQGGSLDWLRWAGVAALLVITVGVGYFWVPLTSQVPDAGVRSAPETSLDLHTTTCPPHNCRLQWRHLPSAEYDVRLTTSAPAFETLYESKGLQEANLDIPPERLQGLQPGATLQVRIAAIRQGQGQIASQTFTILLQ